TDPAPCVVTFSVNVLGLSATTDVASRLGPRWSQDSVVGPATASRVEPAMRSTWPFSSNCSTCPAAGTRLALPSETTKSTSDEPGGAAIVVRIGPKPGASTLCAATAGSPGSTPKKDTDPPAAASATESKRTATSYRPGPGDSVPLREKTCISRMRGPSPAA